MWLFFVYDVFIAIGLIQGYLLRRIDLKDMRNQMFVIFAFLFVAYLLLGTYIVFKALFIRFSAAGRVCSGDYIKKGDDIWVTHQGYFMIYEGLFIEIMFSI